MKLRDISICAFAFLAAVCFVTTPFSVAGQGVRLSVVPDRREARLFDRHTVRPGETAYSIARGYGLSPVTLAEDNEGLDVTRIKVGQILLIRKRERGRSTPEEVAREWARISGSASLPGEAEGGGQAAPADRWSALGDATDARGLSAIGDSPRREARPMRDFSVGGAPDIALMLPLSGGGATGDFADFYNGALLALEALKAQGRSARLTVYDSGRSADKVRSLVGSAGFAETDLIIGPVWEDELEPAVRFGEQAGIPVVSPLAPVGRVDGPTLYQMAPDAASKYDKLRPLISADANVIVVSSGSADDAEFAAEMNGLLGGRAVKRLTVGQGDIVPLLDWGERPNVLVVLGGSQSAVDTALKTISTSYRTYADRRPVRARISVVGSSKWASYNATTNLVELMFKFNTHFVTSYYVNRWDTATRLFEARYLEAFGDFPSRAAFRGYDAVALFGGALFERGVTFADRLEKISSPGVFSPADTAGGAENAGIGTGAGVAAPLGTPYRFVRGGHGTVGGIYGDADVTSLSDLLRGTLSGHYTNDQWTLVTLSDTYQVITR